MILEASKSHIPRGARPDPRPWALDPDHQQAVAERREARKTYQRQHTPDNLARWKDAKKKAAQSEEEARKKSFRTFASEELNRPANLGKVCKILRKMEGGV